jgi:hypothetical protein
MSNMRDLTPDGRAFVDWANPHWLNYHIELGMHIEGSTSTQGYAYRSWQAACAYKDAEYKARIETLEKALERAADLGDIKLCDEDGYVEYGVYGDWIKIEQVPELAAYLSLRADQGEGGGDDGVKRYEGEVRREVCR